jgi:hypothetical protein
MTIDIITYFLAIGNPQKNIAEKDVMPPKFSKNVYNLSRYAETI